MPGNRCRIASLEISLFFSCFSRAKEENCLEKILNGNVNALNKTTAMLMHALKKVKL